MFYTGVHAMNRSGFQVQHDVENVFDDDLSWYTKAHKKALGHSRRIFVTNEGSVATIHVKPRLNKPEIIGMIKDEFRLHDIFGITEVIVTEM